MLRIGSTRAETRTRFARFRVQRANHYTNASRVVFQSTPLKNRHPVTSWWLWKSVVTLAETGNTISGRRFRRFGVSVCQRQRLPLTGSRPDIRLLSYSGKTPTFCVTPVFSVAVTEKCCDVCGDEEYYFRSGNSTLQDDGVSEASTAVDRKSMT
jgi:hypothetical protein